MNEKDGIMDFAFEKMKLKMPNYLFMLIMCLLEKAHCTKRLNELSSIEVHFLIRSADFEDVDALLSDRFSFTSLTFCYRLKADAWF